MQDVATTDAEPFEREVLTSNEYIDPAASQGSHGVPGDGRRVYHDISQQDVVGKRRAKLLFMQKEAEWQTARGQGRQQLFFEDITEQEDVFPWRAFLAGFPTGRELFDSQGVRSFGIVWVGGKIQRPAFWIRTRTPEEDYVCYGDNAIAEEDAVHIWWHV